MFTVNYSVANENNSGSVVIETDTMTEVVTYIESGLNIKLGSREMLCLLTGMPISSGDLDVWITEEITLAV